MKLVINAFLVIFGSLVLSHSSCFAQGTGQIIKPERKIVAVYDLKGHLFSQTNLFSDKYNGFYKTYYPSGQLAAEIWYRDGWQIYDKAFDEQGRPVFRNGVIKTYYADGHLASAGKYCHDMKNGEFKYYYYDGVTVVDIWHYMKGRQVGEHLRNDSYGNFIYMEDWGYPTYYVRQLQYAVVLLGALAVLFLMVIVLYRK